MITRQMTPFFFIYFLSSIYWCISFLHFKGFQIQARGLPLCPPLALCFGLYNTHLHTKDDNFKPVYTDILFSEKVC